MSDRRPSKPWPDYEAAAIELARQDGFQWGAFATKYQEGWIERVAKVVDAALGGSDPVAAVRRGVESGTIKGEVKGLCRVHRAEYDGVVKDGRFVDGAPGCEMWLGAKLAGVEPKPCNVDLVLLMPVSDGGSET